MAYRIRFINVGSGSKGNASFVMAGDAVIMIDMGIPISRVKETLNSVGKTLDDVDVLLITHNHSDHIKGIPLLHGKIQVYAGSPKGIDAKTKKLSKFQTLSFKGLNVTVLPTSHDAPCPNGFLFEFEGEKLLYMTDTGFVREDSKKLMADCDQYVIESNHDPEMLFNSGRPQCLIDRIWGDKGHLNNLQSAQTMAELIGPHTKRIFLAHLSEECNEEGRAVQTHQAIYQLNGLSMDGVELIALRQHEATI